MNTAPVPSDPHWERVERLFTAALDAAGDRAAFLARECAGDPALRAEVETLLLAHDDEGAADRLERDLQQRLRGADPVAGDRFGRYVISGRLASGGMGILYAARDERLDRTVALKLLPYLPGMDPDARERFVLEARAAAALEHPNICAVHEINETEDGRLYIAMPLYRGETLGDRIARGPLDAATALGFALAVAQGLGHAHARGIVHRDIKPANLFVGEDGTLKILDFGIAKVADRQQTAFGAIVGTIPYMSPEQAMGEPVDARTDLWSLGVVLHEMVTGRRPFATPRPEALLAAIISTEPPRVEGIPGAAAVQGVLDLLLAKDRADRPADAEAAAAALRSAMDSLRLVAAWDGWGDGPPISAAGERRQVTVLAVQVGGIAEMVEHWAPDEMDGALLRLREAVAGAVQRFGGVVHRFSGDAVTCLFGVPATHEDDVARAARAARALQAWAAGPWLGEGVAAPALRFRAGLGAGSVVIQPDPATRSHRVAGEPLEAAARLAAHASAGEILAGAECARGLAGFALRDGTPLVARDATAPVVPLVVGDEQAPRAPETAERLALSPLVGRARELGELREVLARARAGEGGCVTVEAEAGAGKSRLLLELTRGGDAGACRQLHLWCRDHHLGAPPYLPFVGALREALELDATADAERVATEVTGRFPELPDAAPIVLHLLGLATERHPLPRHLEGERLKLGIRDTLATLFTLATRRGPVLLVCEDWHWADEASHEALKRLLELAPAYPLAVVVTYRPEYGVTWPAELARTALRLAPLDADASARIIAGVLQADRVADEVRAAIDARADGNPFFVEELAHTLREQGAVQVRDGTAELAGATGSLHLPGTIQGVIRARLDRLDSGAREAARAAAVVGRDFTLAVVRKVVDPEVALPRALERLRQAGLVHQTRVAPEPAYRFKHALTQEVAYDTLLAHRRRVLHGRAGAAIEALGGAEAGDRAGQLAYHYSRAEQWAEAVRHGRVEAQQAAGLSEFVRALRIMERLDDWAQRVPDAAARRAAQVHVLLEMERLCETLGQRQRQQSILDRLRGLLDREADPRTLAEVLLRQGDLHTLQRQFEPARAALEEARGLARTASAAEVERGALRSLGLLCWHAGRSRDGLPFLEQALAIDRALGDERQAARDLYNQGSLLKALGDYDAALAMLGRASDAALAAGDPAFLAYIQYNGGIIHRLRGDNARALELFRVCAGNAFRTHGMLLELAFCECAIGNVLMDEDDVPGALAAYREAVAISRRLHYADGLSQSLRILGTVLAGLGRADEALPCLREAAELFAQLGDRDAEHDLWARIAAVEEARGAHGAAAEAWLRTRTLRHDAGDAAGELEAAGRAARALRDGGGGADTARDIYRDAIDLAEQLGDQVAEGDLRNGAGILEWREGRYAEALAHYERALLLHRALADMPRAGLALNSIGATLLCLRRLEEARTTLEQAALHNRRNGQDLLEAHALATLGDALLAGGAVREARSRYDASLAIRRRIGDRRGEGWMLCQLARAAQADGDTTDAATHRAAAQAIARDLGDEELARASGLG